MADIIVNQHIRIERYNNVLTVATYWKRKTYVEALIEARTKINRRLENRPFTTTL